MRQPVLPLSNFALHYGNLGVVTPLVATSSSMYAGDPSNCGTIWCSCTDCLESTSAASLCYGKTLVLMFDSLRLLFATQYWAILTLANAVGRLLGTAIAGY